MNSNLTDQVVDPKSKTISNTTEVVEEGEKRRKKVDINVLNPIQVNGVKVTFTCINAFTDKNRAKNDSNNKKRENIIVCIINNAIPKDYYKHSKVWSSLKNEIDILLKKICQQKNITTIDNIVCQHHAGRSNHYDFKIIINSDIHLMIEFKFNASCVNDAPQFVSPMHPSQYLSASFEEYYYDNHFIPLVEEFNMTLPEKAEYLKSVHSNLPKCLEEHQVTYYRGCKRSSKYSGEKNDENFYKRAKKTSKCSILNFISENDLDKDKLTAYLLETQKDKYYMLYKEGILNLETRNLDEYVITSITKEPKKSRFIAKTKTGRVLKILLRWKNGNGIAFPSFQIS